MTPPAPTPATDTSSSLLREIPAKAPDQPADRVAAHSRALGIDGSVQWRTGGSRSRLR